MKKNDTYLLETILRIPGAEIKSEDGNVIIKISNDSQFYGESLSECLEVLREHSTLDWIRHIQQFKSK